MPASAVSFHGTSTRVPSVLTWVDDRALTPNSVGSSLIVAIVGQAEGGEPQKPEYFSSIVDAVARVRGGDIYKVLRSAFAPSKNNVAPAIICLVRANPATKGTITLKNSATDIITVTSKNWGIRENGTSIAVATGTLANSKKVTVSDGTNSYVKDNVIRSVLTLAYTGTSMAITVNATGITATVVGGSGSSQTALFANYPTAKKMADFFNAQTGFVATMGVNVDPNYPITDQMDYLTAVSALSQTLYANNAAIVDFLSSPDQPLVTAVKIGGVGLLIDNTTTPRYLAGAGEGTLTNPDWQASFDSLINEPVALISCLSPTLAIQQMLLNHVSTPTSASQARRGYVGAALGAKSSDLSAYRTISDAMNSDRISVVCQGMNSFDDQGNTVTLAPYYMTALAAALQAGYGVGESVTNKPINVVGLEWVPSGAEKELGIDFSLLLYEKIPGGGGFRCLRGISSWRANANFNRVETSVGMVLDEMGARVADRLDPYKGQKATAINVQRMLQDVKAELDQLTREELLVGDEDSPSYQGITGTLQGDVVNITFQASPVIPINFVLVSIAAVPFKGTFSISVQ